MEESIKSFRDALESLDRVGADGIFRQLLARLTPIQAVEQLVVPALEVVWVEEPLYRGAIAALLAADRRAVSLTDWTSFEVMRGRQITQAFAFDPHFAEQGFTTV